MAISPLSPDTFPLSQAPHRLARLRNQKPVHVSTLWRWAMKGIRGVRLETALVGGTRVTSSEALSRFLDEVTRNSQASPASGDPARPRQEEEDLDSLGIR